MARMTVVCRVKCMAAMSRKVKFTDTEVGLVLSYSRGTIGVLTAGQPSLALLMNYDHRQDCVTATYYMQTNNTVAYRACANTSVMLNNCIL